VSLSDAADELYGADPGVFVARRAELVKQARAAGDKSLATQIGALRRPTVAAWYVNLLARSGASGLDDLIGLGATMRQAQAELDMAAVASLAPKRRALEAIVVRRLDMLLATRGITASAAAWAEVGHTLPVVGRAVATSDGEIRAARTRLAAAVHDRLNAQREVDEVGLAYAASQQRLRTSEAVETQARAELKAAEGRDD